MIVQSSLKHMHQKSNSNANAHHIMQTAGDIQSNRNSQPQSIVYSVRNNTTNSNDALVSMGSSSNNNRFNPFKNVCNQQQRAGGQAFDIQIGVKGNIQSNQCQQANALGGKRNSSQDMIPPNSSKNENFNIQNLKLQQQNKQQGNVAGCNQNGSYNFFDYNENLNLQNAKVQENQNALQVKNSDSKKNNMVSHHGGSKSLDQQAFKRMGSCPNNPVQGIQLNNQLHQSTNQPSSSHQQSKGACNLGQNLITANFHLNKGQNNLTNRSGNNSNNLTNHTINTSVGTGNQLNVQHYLNQNKQNNQMIHNQTNNHTRTSSNILSEYQSVRPNEAKVSKLMNDYVSSQPYLSNQFDNKNLVLSQEIDECFDQRNFRDQHQQKQALHHNQLQQSQQQQQQQQQKYHSITRNEQPLSEHNQNGKKEKSSSNERQKMPKQHLNQYGQNEVISNNPSDLYFAKQNSQGNNFQGQQQTGFTSNNASHNLQNQLGSIDLSINNSINQRDISIIRPINIDISCFSRDQSMFLDGNKDVSINMKDQSSFFHQFNRKNQGQNTLTSGFDLPNHLDVPNYITAEKGEYPTLSNPNLNHSKSLILDGLKEMSINYSKVEEISHFLEQERDRNAKLEEKIKSQDDILKTMQEFQNDLFTNYEQAQTVIKQLKSDSTVEQKMQSKIQSLQDENSILREQLVKQEEIYELKYKDLMNQVNTIKEEKDEIQQSLQEKMDSMLNNFNSYKKHYEEKAQKLQQQLLQMEKEKSKKNKLNNLDLQPDNVGQHFYKQIVQQIQQEFDIQKENEILPKIRLLGDKDMIKLTECLTEMMISFAPDGYFEKKPSLKQIWKWIKEVLKEYMKNTTNLKKAIKYVNAEKHQDFIPRLEKVVFENESYYKIIEQMKQYFNLDPQQFSNLYELQLFLEKKNSSLQGKQFTNPNSEQPSSQQDYIYTNLTTDSSKQ